MFYLSKDNDIGYGECIGAGDTFDSQAGLEALFATRKMSKQDVTELWNSFAGVAGPFSDLHPWGGCVKNHKYGAERIWKAIQILLPDSPVDEMLNVEMRKPGEMSATQAAGLADAPFGFGILPPLSEMVDGDTEPCDPEVMTKTKKLGLAAKVKGALAKPRKKAAKATGKAAKTPKDPKAAKGERKPRVKGESKKDQACRLMLRKSGATLEDFKAIGWNEGSVTLFSQWVALVVRNGITSFTIEKNGGGEKVYKAAA